MPAPIEELSPDAEDLRRAAGGDRTAMDAVIDRHAAGVHRYLLRVVGDGDRAEDALQETFIAAWRGAGAFRGEGSARAWLLGIARNVARRLRRRRSGEPERHDALPELAAEAGWGSERALLGRLEARDLVEKGFEQLSAEDREILWLREAEGLPGEETAQVMGISLAAQKSRLHRARLRFMARIREVDGGT